MVVSLGCPKVRVPVLSKATAVTFAIASMVAPFLTRLPRSAALPMEATSAVGVASTMTHGQKTMRMVMARRISPPHHQTQATRNRAAGGENLAERVGDE